MATFRLYFRVSQDQVRTTHPTTRHTPRYEFLVTPQHPIEVQCDEAEGLVPDADGTVLVALEYRSLPDLKLPRWSEGLERVSFSHVTVHENISGLGRLYNLVPGEYWLAGDSATIDVTSTVLTASGSSERDFPTLVHRASITLTAQTIEGAKELYSGIMRGTIKPNPATGMPLAEIDERRVKLAAAGVTSIMDPGCRPEEEDLDHVR